MSWLILGMNMMIVMLSYVGYMAKLFIYTAMSFNNYITIILLPIKALVLVKLRVTLCHHIFISLIK